MPSFCPRCHRVLEQDEVCCAQIRYSWRCLQCHKLTTGFVMPYGRCFLCGGELETFPDRDIGNPMEHPALREALQFELDAYHFYRLAWQQTRNPQHKLILEYMFQNELDHIHELGDKYHIHLDPEVLELAPAAHALLSAAIFRDIDFSDSASAPQLYEQALQMERRTRDHFRHTALTAAGFERELYEELAAEEEEHIAMLETEMRQFSPQ